LQTLSVESRIEMQVFISRRNDSLNQSTKKDQNYAGCTSVTFEKKQFEHKDIILLAIIIPHTRINHKKENSVQH